MSVSNVSKFRTSLRENGFDGAVVSSHFNQFYLSSFDYHDGYFVITEKNAYVITDSRYEEAAHKALDAYSEIEIVLPEKRATLTIADIFKKDGCTNIAFEETDLSVDSFSRISSVVNDVCGEIMKLSEGGVASKLLDKLRVCKSHAEIEQIKRAQAITDAAFEHILKVIKPDMTEIEVALELEFFMRKNGADGLAFDTIAVNAENSSMPHGVPGPNKLKRGFLTMDYGARFGGYCSDMTRTICIGKADDEMRRLYNTVLEAQTLAIEFVEYGKKCADVDAVARNHIYDNGYKGYFGHSLGHGVGLLIHEEPRFSFAAGDVTVDVGHVITVEPGIYLPGKYGCRIEDMITVTEDKQVVDLTHSPKELIEIL